MRTDVKIFYRYRIFSPCTLLRMKSLNDCERTPVQRESSEHKENKLKMY